VVMHCSAVLGGWLIAAACMYWLAGRRFGSAGWQLAGSSVWWVSLLVAGAAIKWPNH
jgi:hypothetical protein